MNHPWLSSAIACLLFVTAAAFAADNVAAADPDLAIQGEYSGEIDSAGGRQNLGAQVIALGDGAFHAVFYPGGLPGDGWTKDKKMEADGTCDGASANLKGNPFGASIGAGQLTVAGAEGKALGTLKKVMRKSPTLGQAPPANAKLLFGGKDFAGQWQNGKVTDDGLLIQGTQTKQQFKDCTLHVEFLLPLEPKGRGQGRGNSGCYLQGRYEVQILDSFGLEGKNNECGGIYGISDPAVNMCFSPLSWQTYDIDFKAAQFKDGKKVANARFTVRHNGVIIQKDVEAPHITTAAPVQEADAPGPIYLQDHGHPVRFRNIWIIEK